MVKLFLSNLGEKELQKICDGIEYDVQTIEELLNFINEDYPGSKNLIIGTDNRILSSTRIFKNVDVQENRFLEKETTIEVESISETISNEDENILISVFDPSNSNLKNLFEECLAHPFQDIEYTDSKKMEPQPVDHSYFLENITDSIVESIYQFKNGTRTLAELEIPENEKIKIELGDLESPFTLFNREKSKLLPKPLVKAIEKIWELESSDDRLRLFQEDALFFILGKLNRSDPIPYDNLLLSIPTGGGKTEAFLIPIVAQIYENKRKQLEETEKTTDQIAAIITYPTKALANDQADRTIEILHKINLNPKKIQISVGILTGDTPKFGGWELRKKSFVQVCPNCGSSDFTFPEVETSSGKLFAARCEYCDYRIDFVRLTRNDILLSPPDILITNLDMINYALQIPLYRPLFEQKVDILVVDEVHLCGSIFGCNASHLLRRLEATTGVKPLYIGVSATIKNAEELASLIFDTPIDNILYLKDRPNRPYLDKEQISHYRHHYALTPRKLPSDRYLGLVTATLNTVCVLGHSIKDPHFRKTIVFGNYREDTDNLIKYLYDQENRYFVPYRDTIREKLNSGEPLARAEIGIVEAVGNWYETLHQLNTLYKNPLELGWHRGGLEQEIRLRTISLFRSIRKMSIENNQMNPIDIVMATNTLELGIDIGDVSSVFNTGAPFTVNEYTQRIGRGGRKRDSAAITVIDPSNPLDFYFYRHFEEYTKPEKRVFEDAPITITNRSIMISHLFARILEFVAAEIGNQKRQIKVKDLREMKISHDGVIIEFEKDPEFFGEAIYEKMLEKKEITELNGRTSTAINVYLEWLQKETTLGVNEFRESAEFFKKKLIDKCRELRDRMNSGEISDFENLTGMYTCDSELVPSLRGSGKVCRVKLIRAQRDEIKDLVPRKRALSSMPPDGFTTQGANTFIIENIERDATVESDIRDIIANNQEVFTFFHKKFSREHFHSNVNRIDFQTPSALKVRFFPYRFYCPRCGRTYTRATDDDLCVECASELRQLTEVYMCRYCGEIYAPPVPKVCMNPDHLERESKFIASLHTRGTPKYELFRFQALPKLHWKCKNCGTVFNYHLKWTIELPQPFLDVPFTDRNFDNAQGVAKHYQYRPESKVARLDRYSDEFGYHPARYYCPECERGGGIRAKNIPTIRSIQIEYVRFDRELLSELEKSPGTLQFHDIDVISLSREHARRFYTEQGYEVVKKEHFPESPHSFLANTYNTHAASLNLKAALIEEFLEQLFCSKIDCDSCDKIISIPGQEHTRPKMGLEKWELTRIPDVRRKWCAIAEKGECDRETCLDCPEYLRKRHLKYFLLHSLKHCLILAMPKYTGVSKNEIRGTIFPNDESKPELIFMDIHEDGSGSIYLLRRNWDLIWSLAEELAENTMAGHGNLMLPQFCERYNRDLCPIIVKEFFDFLRMKFGTSYNAGETHS